jgi:hypothetical protein
MDQTFTISLFDSVGDTRPKQTPRSWAQLCAKFAKPIVREEKDGLLFSPARYRAPRRLIANVIELSLLVLEVDGAWRCDDCGHQGPLVMFRNRRHPDDRCPACKKRNKKLERSNVSQIQFGLTDLAAACRRAFPSAFALYSTHGHLRVTDTNPLAEPRFRIVLPLTEPVPVADFLELWYAAVDSLKEVPADPQVKDPNRIYYTPVKYSAAAPYEFHIEPGEALNWKSFLKSLEPGTATGEVGGHTVATQEGAGKSTAPDLFSAEPKTLAPEVGAGVGALLITTAGIPAPSAVLSTEGIYSSHEARHEELCRRIMARAGKPNGRGNYDARCLAHGGKGTTALFYNPRSGAVSCNRECLYEELLRAEGLDDRKLPSSARVAAWQAAPVKSPSQPAGTVESPSGPGTAAAESPSRPRETPPVLTLARLHVINALLLAHLFELSTEDQTTVCRYWGSPFSEEIEWPGTDNKQPVKVCSFPSRRLQLEAVKKLSAEFDLEGTPGFYRVLDLPGADGAQRREEIELYGPWRLSLDQYRMRPGALLSPYDNNSGYICGIKIHRAIRDKVPFLLTSNGLPGGSKAVAYREVAA